MTDVEIDTTTAHKAIGIETTLCANGAINVRSDRGSGRVHTVFVDSTGDVDRCTCPGFTHHGHCYHSDAIASNGRLRAAARACADRQTIAIDGGHDDEPEPGAEVIGSEAPDMGRGPSGVDDL